MKKKSVFLFACLAAFCAAQAEDSQESSTSVEQSSFEDFVGFDDDEPDVIQHKSGYRERAQQVTEKVGGHLALYAWYVLQWYESLKKYVTRNEA